MGCRIFEAWLCPESICRAEPSYQLARDRDAARAAGHPPPPPNLRREPAALWPYLALVPALVVAIVHAPRILHPECCEYVSYDDPANFVHTTHIDKLSWANLRWAATDGIILGVWEPTSLLFRMIYRGQYGRSAAATLAVSVALHMANMSGLFVLLARRGATHDTRWVVCCLCSVLLVGLHPLCVEAVCWASAQGYPLAGERFPSMLTPFLSISPILSSALTHSPCIKNENFCIQTDECLQAC